jgi:hypothetical protein
MANVFISYSHDSDEHKQAVRELAVYLRNTHGLRVVIDQDMLPGGPPEGWTPWSENQVRSADRVLLVCTEKYCGAYLDLEQSAGGIGSIWEARLIRHELVQSRGINKKYRVVLLEESHKNHIPGILHDYHHFALYHAGDRDSLAQWLLGTTASTAQAANPVWPHAASGYEWETANCTDLTQRLQEILSGRESFIRSSKA